MRTRIGGSLVRFYSQLTMVWGGLYQIVWFFFFFFTFCRRWSSAILSLSFLSVIIIGILVSLQYSALSLSLQNFVIVALELYSQIDILSGLYYGFIHHEKISPLQCTIYMLLRIHLSATCRHDDLSQIGTGEKKLKSVVLSRGEEDRKKGGREGD